MTSLTLATRNPHKTRELAELLGQDFSVSDVTERGDLPVVEETGKTLAENAALKAMTISRLVSGLVLADDSGLEVHSLGGAPGIFSARYAGENPSDAANVAKLLDAVVGERTAQFRCVLVLAESGQTRAIFEGVVHGRIATAPAGTNGFGYDPVFVPDGFAHTFAELGDAIKNRISHRAHAVAQLREYLLTNKKGGEIRRPS